ncbi:hypothetical protein TomTYG75_07470 [Sphingobium sp. TomTYG75]
MTAMLDIDQMITAIHVVTGQWLSGKDAEDLAKLVGTREELLAHGILDLAWLEEHSAAKRLFFALRQSNSMPAEPLLGIDGPPPPMPETGPDRDELLTLVRQFAEDPTEVNPLTTLMRLGAATDNARSS